MKRATFFNFISASLSQVSFQGEMSFIRNDSVVFMEMFPNLTNVLQKVQVEFTLKLLLWDKLKL